jgi:hypothetical protein
VESKYRRKSLAWLRPTSLVGIELTPSLALPYYGPKKKSIILALKSSRIVQVATVADAGRLIPLVE